jgi:peptidoglycan/xylan/chitin deacetylase (PgdA/CDA1 family)
MAEFRADRVATLYLAGPIRRIIGKGDATIPILMYHSVSGIEEQSRHPYYRTDTDPSIFAEQMTFLHDLGYRVISLGDAAARIEARRRIEDHAVVITFDDGYQDFYTRAFPILNRFGYSATMFLPTSHIGEANQSFAGSTCLSWNQVRELNRFGIEFGSHTVTHPQLRTLQPDDIQKEVHNSKQTIEDKLGSPVKSFSYPYAFPETDRTFRNALRQMLSEAGYQAGVSTIIGKAGFASDRLFMERLPVNSCDDRRLLGAKLEGAYDWLHTAQYAFKAVAGGLRRYTSKEAG